MSIFCWLLVSVIAAPASDPPRPDRAGSTSPTPVNVANGPTIAFADAYLVLKNRQKVIGLRGFNPRKEEDALTFAVAQGPRHGVLLGTPPCLTYVPARDFTGEDSFDFTVDDGAHPAKTTIALKVGDQYVPPQGVPMPEFGVLQTHRMYARARFDFLGKSAPYRDDGNGPYTHYVDADHGRDAGNPFGTKAKPRRTIPARLPPGSVVELHGSGFADADPYVVEGDGTRDKPIFLRGSNPKEKPVFRRGILVRSNYLICENIAFDCRDANKPGVRTQEWFSVLDKPPPNPSTYHHVAVRHCLFRDAPPGIPGGATAIAFRVSTVRGLSPNTPTDLIENVVAYDCEVRNFGTWNDFNTSDDYLACFFNVNCNRGWLLDCHLHHVVGDTVSVARHNALPSQAAARNIFLGRNHLHHAKENCVDVKNCATLVISQNTMHAIRLSNSSNGEIITIHNDNAVPAWPYSDDVWVVFNELYDGERAVKLDMQTGRDLPALPTDRPSRVYVVGNVIHHIRAMRGKPTHFGNAVTSGAMVQSRIVANTILSCDKGIYVGETNGSDPSRAATVVRNNILAHVLQPGDANARHIRLLDPRVIPFAAIDHNLHGGPMSFDIGSSGILPASVAALQRKTPFGKGSIEADPRFVSLRALDLRLARGSPAIGAGAEDEVYERFRTQFAATGATIDAQFSGGPKSTTRLSIGAYSP